MHGAIFGQSLSYIRDLFVSVSEMQDRTRLHSAAGLYDVPFTRTHFGRRAFSVAALWSGTVFQTISDRFLALGNLKDC